ncbi:hypothetical protein C0W50_19720 [Photobacterium leiognathi subsp. mandapamensis]|nr:hypothetical protein C0W50_19720 [Photobacterium leiognathi subsp. mandapamensis]
MSNELSQTLEAQIKLDVEMAIITALGEKAYPMFVLDCQVAEYRHDDKECLLQVEIMNNPRHLEENTCYVGVLWTQGEPVQLLVGEDQDTQWPLTAGNLWSLMYCWSFCKEEGSSTL